MIRFIALISIFLFPLASQAKLNILTTTTNLKSLVEIIGGENVSVSSICKGTQDPHVLAELISAIVKGIEKEGLDANLEVLIPSTVSAKVVNQTLVKGIAEKLKEKSVKIGEFEGGAEVKIVDQNITIDMTDDALKALVASFVRDDFRSAFFGNA